MEHSNGLADDPIPDAPTPGDLTPDWASLPPPQVFGAVILVLRAGLPPPVVDTPGEWRARDQEATARDLWELRQMSDAEIAAALTRAETMAGLQPLPHCEPGPAQEMPGFGGRRASQAFAFV